MRLADDWCHILRRAWSVRLIVLAGLLTGLEALLPFIAPGVIPAGILPGLTFAVVAGAFVARLMAQRNMK